VLIGRVGDFDLRRPLDAFVAGLGALLIALFYAPDTFMVYGDAAAVLGQMIEAVKGLGTAAA
jgi:hypothetical protein